MKKILLLMLISFACTTLNAQQVHDTTAIKELLEREAATWRSGDIKAHAACWQIRPYSKILVSTPDGKCFDVPPAAIINPSKDMMDDGSSSNSNYLFSINGNSAWVSHDERSLSRNGDASYSHEIRMLEKIKGKWKLVGQSIHLYKP